MHIFISVFYFLVHSLIGGQGTQPHVGNPIILDNSNSILTSKDNGLTWLDISTDLPPEVNPNSFYSDENGLYLGTYMGIYHGSHLTLTPQWQKAKIDFNRVMSFSPGKKGFYATSQWKGFFQYKTQTKKWVDMSQNLADKNVFEILETKNGSLLASCESGLFRSVDEGGSWQRVYEQGVVNFNEANGVIMAFSSDALIRSTDGGATWKRVYAGIGNTFYLRHIDEGFVAINSGQEFGGLQTPNEIYISKDNGVNWMPMYLSNPPALEGAYQFMQSGTDLFVCSKGGIYKSSDQGKTWSLVHNAPDNENKFFRMYPTEQGIFVLQVSGC